MQNELKPCPKCKSNNGQAILQRRYSNRFASGSDYMLRCDDCGYEIKGFVTEEAAIKAWNRRAE